MQIIVDGIATEYRDEGRGPVLLLLHGWQDSLHTFDALAMLLSKNYRIIRIDLPGFGNTEAPPSAWYLDDYVAYVAVCIQKIGVSVDCVVGHSFGGRVTIKGVATGMIHPEKMVLIASAGVAERRKARSLIMQIVTKMGSTIMWIPPLVFWRAEMRQKLYSWLGSDYLHAGNMREIYLNIIREDLSASAAKIKNQTLLIWGDHDTATPLKEGIRLSKLIKGSVLKIVEGTGHFVHQEEPYKVAEYIEAFLYD